MTNFALRTSPWIALAALLAHALGPACAVAQRNPAATSIRLERLLVLGGDDSPANATFVDVSDIATSASGEIYVVDAGDRAVKVYTSSGRFVRRFGRQGGGPGEFQLPSGLRVDTLVRVSDLGQQRMSLFTLDGRHLQTVRSPQIGDTPLLQMTPLRNGSTVGATPARMGVSGSGSTRVGSPYVAVLTIRQGSPPDTLLRLHSGVSTFHPRDGLVPFGGIDSHVGRGGAHAVLGDSLVATADGYSGEVRWYRADRGGLTLFRTRLLPSRSRPVAAGDVQRIRRSLYAESPDLPRGLVVEPPPRISVATQAVFSTDGALWIRNTAGKGHAHVWTVFDQAGDIALRLSLPAGFELRHVRGDRLYGIARTENDVPVIHVYRLVQGR
ncbi:MAG TPA: 6-bladed beta-propeller [Longimicrobium sp.]|jgi:hypothetical protein|uniref:6-bladed beta-propeller n=1 Tax=Longimicrobium sp. TaxID=2029185 RepID=UPI002ED8E3AA